MSRPARIREADLPIVTVDGEDRKTYTVLDNLHRPKKVIRAWAGDNQGMGATEDCNLMRTTTANDPTVLQQCYREIVYTPTGQIDTVADANNNLTKYLYDALDRRTRTFFPSKSTPGEHSPSDYEEITYNALDQQVAKRTRKGEVIDYTPDALGRLVDRHVPDAPAHQANGRTVTHSYTHNAWGHIRTASHDGETIVYAYDDIGRVTSQTYAGNRVVVYKWDAANNLEKLTWPDGYEIVYVWDANNRVDEAREGATVLADITYDALSRRDVIAYANGTNVDYTWTGRGDLDYQDHGFVGASLGYDFSYNGVGQVKSKTLTDPAYAWAAPTTGTAVYQVNGLNQYTDIDGVSPDHDANGNLTLDHQGRSFGYDAENVLRTATGLAAGTASYRYHADGSRREKSYGGTTTQFYYMGGLGYLDEADTQFAADQEIAEYSGSGTLLRRYIRLPGSIDETFLMIDVPSGTETWAHADRQGSTIATTDASGAVTNKYRYSPYGRPGSEGTSGFPFRYTGQKLDPETGLYYYKARYYDPETGRFLQTDPIGYDDQMNLYAYVGNDPVNLVDPSGMRGCGSRLEGVNNCSGISYFNFEAGRTGTPSSQTETSHTAESIEKIKNLPNNPRSVFEEGLAIARQQPDSGLSDVRVTFKDDVFLLSDPSTDARKIMSTAAAATDFLKANDGWYAVDGTYDRNGGVVLYPTATAPHRFVLPRSSVPRRRFNFGLPGGYAQVEISGIENVIQTLAHETGHHLKIEHGESMLEREWQQLLYYRGSQ